MTDRQSFQQLVAQVSLRNPANDNKFQRVSKFWRIIGKAAALRRLNDGVGLARVLVRDVLHEKFMNKMKIRSTNRSQPRKGGRPWESNKMTGTLLKSTAASLH
jgi:hypothetical protein